MSSRTAALTAVAAAAVASGIAIPGIGGGSYPPSAAPAPGIAAATARGSGQPVVDWNRELITILGTPGAQPATIHPTRSFAMLQAAESDAVASTMHQTPPYGRRVPAAADARPDAAADTAAHDLLVGLYPSMTTAVDGLLTSQLAALPTGQPTRDGELAGAAAAREILDLRSADGSAAVAPPVVSGTQPGQYRPTPPAFPAPVFSAWGSVTPFVLDNGHQLRPAAPPPVTSPAYQAALDEVRSLGRGTSTTRTADETAAATFWSSAPVWNTWNQVAQQLVTGQHASLVQATRVFSALDLSLADTTIGLYDAKYQWLVWRPVTATQVGDTAGSPPIAADPSWTPLTPTAPDPSYPGAHSAISEAAATVLTAFYGPRQAVAVTSAADPGATRSFASLAQAADEAGLSRIWAGQHTRIDHRAGQRLGQQVSRFVLGHLPGPTGSAG